MTAIVAIDGNIIVEHAFPFLPITKLNLKEGTRSKKKFKIPWPGKQYAGAIFSANFSGIKRGIIKTKSKSFRNAVAIDICTSSKNISAKLSKNKIHMCGPNSEEVAIETAQHIVNHLLFIQRELDYATNHPKERDEVVSWLSEATKGNKYIINEETQEIIILDEGDVIRNNIIYDDKGKKKIYKEVPFSWENGDNIHMDIIVDKYNQPYHRSLTKKEKKEGLKRYPIFKIDNMNIRLGENNLPIDEKGNPINKVIRAPIHIIEVEGVKIPDCIVQSLSENGQMIFPKNINSRIATFLINYLQDYAYHHVLLDFFENFCKISKIFTSETNSLKLGNLNIAMVNYSYSLNMNINRWELAQLIDGFENFRARYNNTTDHHVTITVPYEKNKDETIQRKNECVISFMVYKSGIVTQSGPSPAIMESAYYKFMTFINSVRDKIEIKDGKPFSIKFNKVIEN